MINTARVTVTVNKKMLKYADKLVKRSEYKSRSHVFGEALKLLKEKEESLFEKLRDGKLK